MNLAEVIKRLELKVYAGERTWPGRSAAATPATC